MSLPQPVMIVRRTRSARLVLGRGQRRGGRHGEHGPEPGLSVPDFSGNLVRNRRQGGPTQDRALYACGCGYVFDALVSTSVDCPECGDTQAW